MKLLFTSVGRRVELMQAFRRAANRRNTELILFGADVSASAPALFFCDRKLSVCPISDEQYIPSLLRICEKYGIDGLIPTIDTDLYCLAENRERFERIGTKVFISAPDKIRLCRDKRLTTDFFLSCGVKAPAMTDDHTRYDRGFPAFIKPRDGSSSINAYKVADEGELKARAESIEGYIVQPFIEGREYTVDIFCDFEHRPVFITPRERLAVRSGEVLKTAVCMDERMIGECRRIIDRFEPVGAITIQLIRESATGEDYFIEINPRFGGGAPLSIAAGADSAEALIRLLEGERLSYAEPAVDGAVYSRFDQNVCVSHGEHPAVKAVIFDLDDTLYSERAYVRSGFRAVEAETGISADALYDAFLEGKPAIDAVLQDAGKPDMRERCLEVYRNHTPEIRLYEGAEEMIRRLRDRGIFVGIITDGRPQGQRAKLDALGLEVDRVIVTDELGGVSFRKPCDIAFRIMQRAANVDFSQMVYVGDNAKKDFQAPAQLGMQSVWFDNPDGLYRDDISHPRRIGDLRDLMRLIE